MKRVLAILALTVSTASAQTMYKMESIPIYDEDGNLYQMRQVIDHLPTHDDTIEFDKSVKEYLVEIYKARRLKMGIKQYEAIVSEVKTDKNNNLVVKPKGKFKSTWYKCYDGSVKVGDTILISREDAIEPKF